MPENERNQEKKCNTKRTALQVVSYFRDIPPQLSWHGICKVYVLKGFTPM
jgi:hypothetical protein